jgi:uncharacterized Zn finger protein
MDVPESEGDTSASVPAAARLLSASLPCENCGRTTPHRILRWDPRATGKRGPLSGVARCQECRWTHPFTQSTPSEIDVALVLSEGPRSTRRRVQLPAHRRLQVGSGVPGESGSLLIRRIDTRTKESVDSAVTDETSTIWATREGETSVPVSIVERARTRAVRWLVSSDTQVGVGDEVQVDGSAVVVVGIRARGHTWRRVGDRFIAPDVQRVYARRREMPPAGSSDWSRVRVKPSSPASSTSRASRARSSPGTKTARTVPREATAGGGAAVQSVSPW